MYKALENSLFVKDRDRYDEIRKKANSFNSNYTGSNIIQDDIFHIVENYVLQQDKHMEMLRYRLGDDDLCACTFIRGGRVFVVINAEMTLSKQILQPPTNCIIFTIILRDMILLSGNDCPF